MIKWVIGTVLYFTFIGLWFIILVGLFLWGIVLLLPTMILWWLVGVLSGSFFKKTEKWPKFRSFWLWEYIRKHYFQYSVHGPGRDLLLNDDETKGKIMWTVNPHGIFPWTAIFYWGLNPKYEYVVPCIHSSIFLIPLIRDMAGWIGCTSVKREDIEIALKKTGRIVMAPGGIADIANTGNTVKKRYGFLRLAKRTGSCVVPIWIPEERSYYRMWLPFGRSLERFFRYPIPMFMWGSLFLPFLPKKIQTRIYAGDPISLENISVEKGYELYYKSISELQKK